MTTKVDVKERSSKRATTKSTSSKGPSSKGASSKKGVTLKDVALYAGVGTTTASDILLRGKTNYAEKTIEKVQLAAEQLQYRANKLAQNFKTGKTMNIGLLVGFDIQNPLMSALIKAIEQKIEAKGYMCLTVFSDQDDPKNERAIKNFESGQVDAILAGPVYHRESLYPRHAQFQSQIPTVLFLSPALDGFHTVNYQMESGLSQGVEVCQTFLDHGHQRIGYLCCPEGNHTDRGESVLRSFYETLQPRGLFNPDWIWHHRVADADVGYEMMCKILDGSSPEDLPTAYYVHNDYAATGVLAALRSRGVRVPEDVSIITSDDTHLSRYAVPSLSSVHFDPELLAEKSVRELFYLLENPKGDLGHHTVSCHLVHRESVKRIDA